MSNSWKHQKIEEANALRAAGRCLFERPPKKTGAAVQSCRQLFACASTASRAWRERMRAILVSLASTESPFSRSKVCFSSASWSAHIFRSSHVVAEGVKVFSGADGFDPDNSRDVVLRSIFVHSNDDAIAVTAATCLRPPALTLWLGASRR